MSTHKFIFLVCWESRGLWLLLKRIHTDIWVVSETRIHAETQENLNIPVEKGGKFAKPVNILIHKIMTSKYHWDIFTQLGPILYHFIAFWNFERNMRAISSWIYPQGFYRVRRWKYPQRKFFFISPGFPRGSYEEFPYTFAWKSGERRWLDRWDSQGHKTADNLIFVKIIHNDGKWLTPYKPSCLKNLLFL